MGSLYSEKVLGRKVIKWADVDKEPTKMIRIGKCLTRRRFSKNVINNNDNSNINKGAHSRPVFVTSI